MAGKKRRRSKSRQQSGDQGRHPKVNVQTYPGRGQRAPNPGTSVQQLKNALTALPPHLR